MEVHEGLDSVRVWMDAVHARGTGSAGTKKQYIFCLRKFLDWMGVDPDGLLRMDPKEINRRINTFIREIEDKGAHRKYSLTILAAVRSFLRANDVILTERLPKSWISKKRSTITRDQVRKFIDAAPLRLRAFVCVMKDSGLAPVDILKLNYGDVRKDLEAGKAPVKISILRTKTKQPFETFLGPDAIQYLKLYLETRGRGTQKIPPEALTDSSPLFVVDQRKRTRVDYNSLQQTFVRERGKAGVDFEVYDLRKFFSTNMRAAGVSDVFVEYMMGHKLPGQIDAYLVHSPEEMSKIYMGAYPRIALREEVGEGERRKAQVLDTLKLLGISEEKFAKIREMIEAREFGEDLLEEIGETLRANGTKVPAKRAIKKPRRSRPRKRDQGLRDHRDPPLGCS